MAGIEDPNKTEQRSKSFDPRFNRPLDSRDIISSISAIDTELDIDQRYIGQEIFVQDEGRTYTFIGDVTSISLVKNVLIKTFTLDAAIDVSTGDTFQFDHSLQTTELMINILVSGAQISQFYSLLPDELDPLYTTHVDINVAQWKTDSGLTELPIGTKIIIIY